MPAKASAYGIDLGTHHTAVPDLSFRQITGGRVVVESVVRRWTTPRGTLVTDPNACIDIRAWLNASLDSAQLRGLANLLNTEAEQDSRVSSCDARVSFDFSSSTLTIRGQITLSNGEEYPFVVSIGTATAEILEPPK